jgi:hypothetical protein
MSSAATLRLQIETALANRIPSALTPRQKIIRPVAPTGIDQVDELLQGGLPIGAITEMVGPESSGRTAVALAFLSNLTHAGRACAWIDASDTLDPESAAAAGVDLARLLWVRCGTSTANVQPPPKYNFALPGKYLIPKPSIQGLHGGGCGGHPRNEVKGLSEAVNGLLLPEAIAPPRAEPQPKVAGEREVFASDPLRGTLQAAVRIRPGRPWTRIEQALRVTDLLLQTGGFSAIVFDMGSIAPEFAARVPLATWFRYRAAAERTHMSFLLLTQYSCAKSSGELLLRFQPGHARSDRATVFTGIEHHLEVERQRFAPAEAGVTPLRKPPRSLKAAHWKTNATWAGAR